MHGERIERRFLLAKMRKIHEQFFLGSALLRRNKMRALRSNVKWCFVRFGAL